MMKIVSLTGGIGSGKSTAAHILQDLGAVVIDADKVAHAVIEPGKPAWQEITETFGRDILLPDRTIDRKKLAGKVFSDPAALTKLNQITHPRVNQEIRASLERGRRDGTDVMVVEVQIISGADWVHLTDEVWVVQAPQQVRLARLQERGLAPAEALKRMAAQVPVDEKLYPKVVNVDNSGDIQSLRVQLEKLWQGLHNKG
jgi:dephospho-CoA kinase